MGTTGPRTRILGVAALLFAVLACLGVLAPSAFAATTFSNVTPADGSVVTVKNPLISIKATDLTRINPASRVMKVDGASVVTTYSSSTYAVTINYRPAALAEGTHTVSVSVTTYGGVTTTYQWSFFASLKPSVGTMTPADGSVTTTSHPTVSAVVGVKSGTLATYTMTLDGDGVGATYDPSTGLLAYTPSAALRNDTVHTASIAVTDSAGGATAVTWRFTVQIYADMNDTSGCTDCHSTYPAAHPMTDCLGCHGPGSPVGEGWNVPYDTGHSSSFIASMNCTYCHSSVYPVVPEHRSDIKTSHTAVDDMSGCACHVRSLSIEHNRYTTPNGSITCVTCHASTDPNVVAAIASGRTDCASCHPPVAGDPHGDVSVQHTPLPLGCTTTPGCHTGDVRDIHAGPGCDACHGPGKTASTDCSVCHDLASPHGDLNAIHTSTETTGFMLVMTAHDGAAQGSVYTCGRCHPTTNLLRLHGTTWNNCSLCHASGGPRSSFSVWNKTCQQGGCHVSLHDMSVADANHAAVADEVNSRLCYYCHSGSGYAYYTEAQNCTRYCHRTPLPLVGDATPPSTTSNNVGLYKSAATFQLSSSDSGSGVHATFFRINAGAWASSLSAITTVTTAAEGTVTVDFYSVDNVDNAEAVRTIQFVVDSTPPVTSTDATANYVGGGTIRATVKDPAPGSGVSAVWYSEDGGTWWKTYTNLAGQVDFSVNYAGGDHTLSLYAVDGLGNAEATKTITYHVKETSPPTTLLDRQIVTTDPSLSAFDALGGSGVKATYYRWGLWEDGVFTVLQDWQVHVASPPVTGTTTVHTVVPITGPNGMYHLEWYSIDNDGNVESVRANNISLERP